MQSISLFKIGAIWNFVYVFLHFLFFYGVQCMGLYYCEYIIDNILIKLKLSTW